jgi:hypothetical protein
MASNTELLREHLELCESWQRQVFVDEMQNTFSVGLAAAYAAAGGGEYSQCFEVAALPVLSPIRLNMWRLAKCSTTTPLLILVQASGRISIADGRHRLAKAKWLERRRTIPAWILPWTYAAKSSCRIRYEVFDNL